MDTEGGKNWGYPGNAKRRWKQGKLGRENEMTKPNKSTSRTKPENKAASKQDPIQQPAWVSTAAGAIATRGLSPPYFGNTRSHGDTTREKRRARNASFSGLGCMSPESCSKVFSAAKLLFNGY